MGKDATGQTPVSAVEPTDLRATLLAFCRRYVPALVADPQPNRAFGLGQWRPHPQLPFDFVPLDGLMPVQDAAAWEEYEALEPLFRADSKVLRHLTLPRGSSDAAVPDFAGLLAGVITMPLERKVALHGTGVDWIPEFVDDAIAWLYCDDDPMFVAIPLVGLTSGAPLALAPNISVRRASDDEVSMLLRFGAIDVEHAAARLGTKWLVAYPRYWCRCACQPKPCTSSSRGLTIPDPRSSTVILGRGIATSWG